LDVVYAWFLSFFLNVMRYHTKKNLKIADFIFIILNEIHKKIYYSGSYIKIKKSIKKIKRD
jgi:hypothetical protein